MITKSSAEWVLLSQVYHHVLSQSPSSEFAKIGIFDAMRNGQLRLRARILREHKAQPDLRLAPGEKPPESPRVDTPDYAIAPDTEFDHFDWERSRADRQDRKTKSLFQYLDIVVHRDDVLARWPSGRDPPTRSEMLSLKPGMWGVSVDIKELVRRAFRWWHQRNS